MLAAYWATDLPSHQRVERLTEETCFPPCSMNLPSPMRSTTTASPRVSEGCAGEVFPKQMDHLKHGPPCLGKESHSTADYTPHSIHQWQARRRTRPRLSGGATNSGHVRALWVPPTMDSFSAMSWVATKPRLGRGRPGLADVTVCCVHCRE